MKVCPTCSRLYRTGVSLCPKDGHFLQILQEWQAGDSISGKYHIFEKIGHGSLGPTFKARILPSGGIRILKSLASRLAEDETLLEGFGRRIQAASALRHRHAIHIEALEWSDDGRPFIVMEYSPGLSLRDLMLAGNPLTASYLATLGVQICAALECGHSLGILHQNLKPENLSIIEELEGAPAVKVMEFGFAGLRELAGEREMQVGDVELTDRGPLVGTREYMSPEQAAGARVGRLDGRADLYSLGVVMFEALTGDLPSYTEDPAGRLLKVPDTPENEGFFGVLLKAMQPEPDARFQSAAEMGSALRSILTIPVGVTLPEAEVRVGGDGREAGLTYEVSRKPFRKGEEAEAPGTVARQPAERPSLSRSGREAFARPSSRPREVTPFAEVEFDEMRQSLRQSAPETPPSPAGNKGIQFGAMVAAFVGLAFLAFWAGRHWPGHPAAPQALLPGDQQGLVPPHSQLGRQFASGTEAHRTSPPSIRPRSGGQEPSGQRERSKVAGLAASGEESADRGEPSPPVSESPPNPEVRADQEQPGNQPGRVAESGELPVTVQLFPAQEAAVKEKVASGWVSMKRKEYRAAIRSFTEALRIDPSNVEAQAALRLARYASQNPEVDVIPSPPPAAGDSGSKR